MIRVFWREGQSEVFFTDERQAFRFAILLSQEFTPIVELYEAATAKVVPFPGARDG